MKYGDRPPVREWWGQYGEFDLALTENEEGRIILHVADCPEARKKADNGDPVITMYACKSIPGGRHHDCVSKALKELEEKEAPE